MGFNISSGSGSFVPQGDPVPEGLAVGRFIVCDEVANNFDGTSFQWDIELFNANGKNPWVRIWTNTTMSTKGRLFHIVEAIKKGNPEAVDGINNTDNILGLPFQILVHHHEVDGEDGKVIVNRATKAPGYTILAFNGDNPFTQSVEEVLAGEHFEADQSDDIPF